MLPFIRKELFDTNALVDTGASGSCISNRFAKDAGLVSFFRRKCHTAQGSHIVPVYRLDVIMPNNVLFADMANGILRDS
jgi:predicted aspartyl protease